MIESFNIVSSETLFDELEKTVGLENICYKGEKFEEYTKTTSMENPKPIAFVFPASLTEIQELVKIAKKNHVSLWPVSQGKNWGYGSASANRAGSIILVLKRLNKIIYVDEKLAYAVIEPGVTYRQLSNYLRENNLALCIDCTDGPPEGSVLGNALDRGVGMTSYGDHFANICGMEVILPNGEVTALGNCTTVPSKTWNTHKWGVGPFIEGLFSQSNFGIVTKAGMLLQRKQTYNVAITLELYKKNNLPKLIDSLRELSFKNIIDSKIHIINDFTSLSVFTEYPIGLIEPYFQESTLNKLKKENCINDWTLITGISGEKKLVDAKLKLIKKSLGPLGKIQFFNDTKISILEWLISKLKFFRKINFIRSIIDFLLRTLLNKTFEAIESLPSVHGLLTGIPTEHFVRHAYFRPGKKKPNNDINPARDECGLIWFAPLVPMQGAEVEKLYNLLKQIFEQHQFNFYAALLMLDSRNLIMLTSIFFNINDSNETHRASVLYQALHKTTKEHNYQSYRVSTSGMNDLFKANPTYQTLLSSIKRAIDPDQIISPGKYGIE